MMVKISILGGIFIQILVSKIWSLGKMGCFGYVPLTATLVNESKPSLFIVFVFCKLISFIVFVYVNTF